MVKSGSATRKFSFGSTARCTAGSISTKTGSLHSIDIPPDPTKARPPHFIAVNGEELKDFQVTTKMWVRRRFGHVRRRRKLDLTGYAKTSQGVIIEKKLAVELYQDFPDAALVSAASETRIRRLHRGDPIIQ
jgi:hypothetical protein